MSEFHRMVTYLYLYENGVKTRNVGYAKIEKRDAQCLIEIHMKNTGLNDSDLPVYFYTQINNSFPGILIGSIHLAHGSGDFKELLSSSGLAGTDYSISNVKGIFLPHSDKKMIVSQWDDDIFDRKAFLPVEDFSVSESLPVPKNSSIPEHSSTPTQSDVPALPPAPDLKAAEAAPALSPETSDDISDKCSRWNFIMENFPSVTPFPTEDSFQWVQLELKDLQLLPKSYRYLGNNSFLLHGFFNYHHLILGRKKDTHPHQWVLGIPGVFQNPERVMAAIFGFPEFSSTSESNTKTGQFGYWLRPLD